MTDDKWECISIEVEQDSYIDIFVCPRCSALVKDENLHVKWHNMESMYWGPIGGMLQL